MLDILVASIGLMLIGSAFADMTNTLISTSTSPARWWPTTFLGQSLFSVVRWVALRLPESSMVRERLLAAFGPILVIVLLATWVLLQVVGYSFIWWAMDDVDNMTNYGDALYYSGVVYFTVGFGEIVPTHIVPRLGALIEAFSGVVTMALVIGYLPSLYGAYSDRERKLITLDAGSDDRISPTSLLIAWAPDADPKKIDAQFAQWEQWAAGILETHSSVPLLVLFRSHDQRQNWVTALGLLADAALEAQFIMGATDGYSFWFLRRAEAIFRQVTMGHDLEEYQVQVQDAIDIDLFREAYDELEAHGFRLRPFDDVLHYCLPLRTTYGPALEYLIDSLVCPRGFWSHHSMLHSWTSEFGVARHYE